MLRQLRREKVGIKVGVFKISASARDARSEDTSHEPLIISKKKRINWGHC